MGPQVQALRRGVDILVATPGPPDRPSWNAARVDLSGIEILVLDEADRMLDMGFLPAIKTHPAAAAEAAPDAAVLGDVRRRDQGSSPRNSCANPAEVQIAARNAVAAGVTHVVHPVDAARKRDLLLHLLGADSRRQSLVFSRTKHGADKSVRAPGEIRTARPAAIHGNKEPGRAHARR